MAEFFTSLRLESLYTDGEDEDISSEEEDATPTAFIVPDSFDVSDPDTFWTRDSMFDARRGSIGLAWSIFKLLGSPCEDNWPVRKFLKLDFLFVCISLQILQ